MSHPNEPFHSMSTFNMVSMNKHWTISSSLVNLLQITYRVFLASFLHLFIMPSNRDFESCDQNNKESSNTTIVNDQTTASAPKNPNLSPRNPFYLHPCEKSSFVLDVPPLNDNNFNNWRNFMHRAYI